MKDVNAKKEEYIKHRKQFDLLCKKIQDLQAEMNNIIQERSKVSAVLIRLEGWLECAGVKNVDNNQTNLQLPKDDILEKTECKSE